MAEPQHFLYLRPLPQVQGALRPTLVRPLDGERLGRMPEAALLEMAAGPGLIVRVGAACAAP